MEQRSMSETQTIPLAELYGAMAKAQGAFQPIVKNREVEITMKSGGKFKFRYADLEEILAKTRPALSANGLALMQTIGHSAQGQVLICVLAHSSGGSICSEAPLPSARDFADPKALGAAISYLRRYLVTAMLGVAADDDLDEEVQGIGSNARPKSAFDLEAANKAVQAATTLVALEKIWHAQGGIASAAKDTEGYASLKALVVDRKAVLEGKV